MSEREEIRAAPTINDIARVAQVSLATVDRVLNARPGVREKTVRRVNKAIEDLGYVRDQAAANLARGRIYNFLFILPSERSAFVSALAAQITQHGRSLNYERTRLSVAHVKAFDPIALAAQIEAIDPGKVDGVAIFGPETPSVRDSVARLKSMGIVVVSLVSDLPSSERDRYVGIDNVAAGRTAAQLLGRFVGPRSGSVLVIMDSTHARDHLERRLGFDEVMARDFPQHSVLASLEARDDPELVARLMPEVVAAHPDIVGIYSSAAGNEGLLRHFRGAAKEGTPTIIAHGMTDLTIEALRCGIFDAAISQDTGHLVRSAVRVMRALSDNMPINASQERIRIDIYLKENLPV